MKKLLTLAPLALLATACTSTHIAQPEPSQIQAVLANSQTYQCDNNAQVISIISERHGDNYANIQITAPSLSLNQAAVQLKQDVSASGNRFTAANDIVSYDWHIKGKDGVLTVATNGKEYDFRCTAQ